MDHLTLPEKERLTLIQVFMDEAAGMLGKVMDRAGQHYDSKPVTWQVGSEGTAYAIWLTQLGQAQASMQHGSDELRILPEGPRGPR